ncbi:DUF2339 domain-containing protein [Nocardia sp. NPDC024068]|uniref:DUF2339 domain-containing protein n=1 Tax=Nocardia sp. NPDC024068 TaxID=3157197 RepID=UPI0033E305A5
MTPSIDPALIARLSGALTTAAGEFTTLGDRLSLLGRDLESLREQVTADDRTPSAAAGAPARGASDAAAHRATPDETGSADRPERTTASPTGTAPDATPSPGVRVGGVHTPGAPGAAVPDSGAAAPGQPTHGTDPPAPPPAPTRPTTVPWGVPPAPAQPGPPSPASTQFSGIAGRPHPQPRPPLPSRARYEAAMTTPPIPSRTSAPGNDPGGPPPTPWWQREGVISRILAVAGVGVTLIGVVMLLVLAAQAGIFGPIPRVVAGGVLAAALVGAGMRVYHRAGGRVGGIALAATGFAGAYLDVIAMTTIYDWLAPVPGFVAALGIAAAGVGLAMQWRSQALAVLVVTGAAVLAPIVTVELALPAFLIVLQLACVPVQYRFDWSFLHVVRTVPAVLATHIAIVAAVVDSPGRDRAGSVLAAAVAVAAVGLVGAIVVGRRRPGDIVSATAFALATTPLLSAPALFDRPASVVISAAYAAVLLTVTAAALLPRIREIVRIPGQVTAVAAIAGSFALLQTCLTVTSESTLPLALFPVAACCLAIAGQTGHKIAAIIGACFAIPGGLAFLAIAGPYTLTTESSAVRQLGSGTAASAIAGLGLVAVALWALLRPFAGRRGGDSATTLSWIVFGVAGLYLVTTAAVSAGVAARAADGFRIGHGVATIAWMATALAALLFGLRAMNGDSAQTAKAALASGLLLTAAALAKLFLFDLATLGGVVRVAAFLVVGILLLVAGTRYARAFAEYGSHDDELRSPVPH